MATFTSDVKSVTVIGVEVPFDSEGRYNMNALHRAYEKSVGKPQPQKAPSQWLRRQDAKDFISTVSSQRADLHSGIESVTYEVLKIVNGGNAPGTFAHELIAVEYAGWLSPEFRIRVNQTFINFRSGKLQPAASHSIPQTYAEALRTAADLAEQNSYLDISVKALAHKVVEDAPYTEHGRMAMDGKPLTSLDEWVNLLRFRIDRRINEDDILKMTF